MTANCLTLALAALQNILRALDEGASVRLNQHHHLTVPPSWRIVNRVIPDQHLLFVHGGRGMYWIDGHPVPLQAGLLVWIGQNVVYAAEPELNDPPTITALRFSLIDANKVELEPLADRVKVNLLVHRPDLWNETLSGVRREVVAKETGERMARPEWALRLVCLQLFRELDLAPGGRHDPRIARVRRYMEDNPLERTSMEQLARQAELSPRYLTTLFRQEVGCPPKHYQLRLRMHYARDCLENGLNLKSVAEELGYSDPFLFSRQFKQILGVSPSALRKS